MSSGWPASAALASVTVPAMGAYTSEAALTDSTTAQASPAASFLPASGTSTKTRSPSASCAWSVMPTSTLPSGNARIHSCFFVYLRSAGMLLLIDGSAEVVGLVDLGLAVARERRLHDACREPFAADIDLDSFAGIARHARESDGLFERGRESAAGDFAFTAGPGH